MDFFGTQLRHSSQPQPLVLNFICMTKPFSTAPRHWKSTHTALGAPVGIPITYSVFFFFFLSKHDFAYTRLAFSACSLDDFGPFSTLILSVALGVVSHLCISEKRDLVNRKTTDFPLWSFLPWQSKSRWKTALIEHDGLKNRALTVDISVVKLGIMLW